MIENYVPQGLDIAVDILNEGRPLIVYYDPDIDGIIAGELFDRFPKYFGIPTEYIINNLRQHGVKLPKEEWDNYKGKTLVVVDAGIPKDLFKELIDYGINILNIDHHHISENELLYYESDCAKGVVINNNYHFEPKEWNFLSGAGVVYYVVQNICGIFGDEEQALVGLTLLSDIRDLSEQQAKEFLWKTYSVRTPYLAYLVDVTSPEVNYSFGKPVLDRNYIDYTFNPKINASLRCGLEHEIVALFKGNYPHDETRLAAVRNLQNKVVTDMLEELEYHRFDNYILTKIPSTYTNFEGIDITTIVGLTCSRILSAEGKTTIMLVINPDGSVKRGSLRGKCHDVDYLHTLRSFGVKAEGHAGAFGILEFDREKVNLSALDKELGELEMGYDIRKYKDRIHEISNLGFFVASDLFKNIAEYNNYVRDYERIYVRYTGDMSNVTERVFGRKIEYIVDGVTVTCFSPELSLTQDLLLPLTERGNFRNIFLHKY